LTDNSVRDCHFVTSSLWVLSDHKLIKLPTAINEMLNLSEHSTECVCFLYSYGFYRSHCLEALELTHGDVGVALEVLLSQYFKLGLKFPFILNNNSITNGNNFESAKNHPSSEILQHREEEKCVLESIYDSAFEERIANRLWVLNLQLEYLLDFFSNSDGRENDWNNKRDLEEDRDGNCDRDLHRTAKSQPQFCR